MDTMVEGTTEAPGLMRVWPPHQRPELRMSRDNPHLTAHTGAIIRLRAAQKADRFRGPQAEGGWADEIDSWKPEQMPRMEAWALFELGIRLGDDPRIIATSTPKRAGLVGMLAKDARAHVTRGSTFDNRANLARQFFETVVSRHEGTRLGRQELYGEILDDVDGAILNGAQIDATRVSEAPDDVDRIVVGVDPAATSGEHSDKTGINAAGRAGGELYSLADRSIRGTPERWGRRAVETYHGFGADLMVGEANNGGEMVEHVVKTIDKSVNFKLVHASRGKHKRAEPILALYEQGRAHVVGEQGELEDQLCGFTLEGYDGDGSPDAADAHVWAGTELMLGSTGATWRDLYGGAEAEGAAA